MIDDLIENYGQKHAETFDYYLVPHRDSEIHVRMHLRHAFVRKGLMQRLIQ